MPERPSFSRSPRLQKPLPAYQVDIPSPGTEIKPETGLSALLPMILPVALMVVVMVVIARFTGFGTTFLLLSIPMMVVGAIASVIIFFQQKRRAIRKAEEREVAYLDLLRKLQEQLADARKEQAELMEAKDPSPASCYKDRVALRPPHRHLWTRIPDDPDFLVVRVGLGEQRSRVIAKPPQQTSVSERDPLIDKAQALAREYATLHDVPLTISLPEARVVGIGGPRRSVVQACRALVMQLATHHAPDAVKLVALYPAREAGSWEWLRWLPHVWDGRHQSRLLADDPVAAHALLAGMEEMLNTRKNRTESTGGHQKVRFSPAYVFLIGDSSLLDTEPFLQRLQKEGPDLGAYSVFLESRVKAMPPDCRAMVRIAEGRAEIVYSRMLPTQSADIHVALTPDLASAELADRFARSMARLRYRQAAMKEIPATVSLLEMLRVRDVESLHIARRWEQSRQALKSVAAPIGVRMGGEPLILDLHERRHGPNGLVAGTVGAGKSELLQTLVASLAICYHPHRVAFALIDYKAGGMARPLELLPHNLGVLTDLAKGSLAARVLTSLDVELRRREGIFSQEHVSHIDEYQRLHLAGKVAIPLPHLVFIVDEFAEMKSEKPELAAQFVRIARKGRALGLCLILAMQKPSGIVDGQIEANTRFRLCLRVASTEDSQAMLHRPDAAFLTGVGRSYLQVGANEVFDLFQVAWSGDRYDPEGITASDPDEIVEVALDGSRQVLFRPSRPESQPLPDIKQLDAVVAHLADTAQTLDIAPLEKLWLDPLPDHLALQDLPRAGGWNGATWEAVDGLVAPVVGRLDDPLSKTQDPLRLDLGRRGHLLLYGAPGTGKTTFVQTLITSLAMSYSPDDVHIYIMDFGGKMLKMYEGAVPHVGGVVVADETERIDRLFQFLREEVADRRARFGAARAATLDSYRRLTGESLPAIVVVLDNYANFQTAYQNDDDKLDAILHLARDGGSCGIHLVMTTNEITSVRLSVSSNVNLRLTLNLADTSDYSAIVGRTHGLAPEPLPGRGLIAGSERPLEYQVALPAPGETDADRIAYLHDLFQVMREAWRGDWARQIRVLPAELSLADLLHPTGRWHVAEIAAAASTAVPLGLKVADLKPLIVDLATSSLFLITGMIHSGKTSLLHSWLFSLAAHNSPENLHFFIVDSKRGGLWPLREELKHVKLYADNPADAENLFRSILSEVDARQQWLDERRRNRLPVAAPPGPRLVIAIDDLLHKHNDSTGGWLQASEGAANDFGSPTASRLLTLGNDLGVHLLVVTPFDGDWFSAVGKALTAYQTGIQLGTTSDTVFNVPGGVNPHLLPPGDGFWCLRGKAVKARFAHLDTDREQMPQPDVSTDSSS